MPTDGRPYLISSRSPDQLKRILSDWQLGMQAGGGWNALFWCNHDQPRVVSRFGHDGEYRERSAKMLGTALHFLQGTPFVYQGEELGMTNPGFESIEHYRDVETLNIFRLKREAGDKSFWDPQVYGQLPPETRDYVPYVLAAAWLFLHPEEYGLEFPKVDGAATVMKLQAPASIYQLSICLGGPREGYFRALRNLNPRYEPHAAIAAGTELRVPVAVPPEYQAHCVAGPRAQIAANLMAASKPTALATATRKPAKTYRVKSGDTLSGISRRHDCEGPVALAKANGLRPPYVIRSGQRLRLVGCG